MTGGKVITVQARTRATDSQGGWTQTWNAGTATRGYIRSATAREISNAAKLEARVTHVATLRGGETVAVEDRLYTGGLYYRVHAVRKISLPNGQAHHLEVDCEEVQVG